MTLGKAPQPLQASMSPVSRTLERVKCVNTCSLRNATGGPFLSLQGHLGGIAASVPDGHNNSSIRIKPASILLLAEGLAFTL